MVMLLHGGFVRAENKSEKRTADREIVRAHRMGSSLAQGERVSKEIEIRRFGHNALLKSVIDESTMELVCLLCTQSELVSKARELGVISAARHAGKEPAMLSVLGLGETGMVVVDSLPMTPNKKEHPIEPGEHDIVFVIDGKAKGTFRYIAAEQKLEIDVEAVEVPSPERTYTGLKVLLGGLGLTAAAIGGVFLWLDDSCATENCEYLHDLAPAGWTLVSMGVAAEIGLLLWLFLPRANTESAMETDE
jgi:predicted secreted protein